MSELTLDDSTTVSNVQEPTAQNAPLTPPSPDEVDVDLKASRKREREVSLEPATPKADDSASEESKETRSSAPKKKNRVQLGTTKEEDETPPESPDKTSVELATSPPYETKVRQISRKVRGMKWDDRERTSSGSTKDDNTITEANHTANSNSNVDVELEAPAEIISDRGFNYVDQPPTNSQSAPNEESSRESPVDTTMETPNEVSGEETQAVAPPETAHSLDSGSDDQEKDSMDKNDGSSASVDEKSLSVTTVEVVQPDQITVKAPETTSKTTEPTKRARDDTEEDDANPREKKRPTPPPEELKSEKEAKKDSSSSSAVSEPVAPQPKSGGFLAYASTSSPFASAKGPSVFGQRSTPSPSPLAGTSNGSATSLSSTFGMKTSSPFAISSSNKNKPSMSAFASSSVFASSSQSSLNNPSTSPTGLKRSGFEAFASPSSPFASAASRSKSPPSGFGLARSKSPTRRGSAGSVNAFKSYTGSGSQSFSAPSPPVKKLRQDSGDDGEESKPDARNVLGGKSSNTSSEGSEGESEKPTTFSERLRAGQDAGESQEGSEEDEKSTILEQEVQTGEENEDTIFQVRGKLYALSQQNAWKERGTGLLKLNVRKSDGGGARLVMRKEAVYSLLLNVPLFKGMRCNVAQDPRYVRFSVIELGSTVHYNLRLSNAKVASELIEEITANIPSEERENTV